MIAGGKGVSQAESPFNRDLQERHAVENKLQAKIQEALGGT
jgi:hypothetical protein